jgi:ketosteroid isomerase-like protein
MPSVVPAGPAAPDQGETRQAPPLAALVEAYFAAVDRMDLGATLDCFTEDARVTIATFDTVYHGRDTEIQSMYSRLFARYASVWHGDFDHVAQSPGRIASQFTVRNVSPQGVLTVKHNCNFFRFHQGRICDMSVYMSGDNSLG